MLRWITAGAVVVLVAALSVPAMRHWRERSPAPPATLRLKWEPPVGVETGAGLAHPFELALSPDGRQIAFPAMRSSHASLWLQDLTSAEARELPSSDDATMPFWSPDGRRLGYFAAGRVRSFDLESGSTTDLVEAPAGRGAAWNTDGDLVFAPNADGVLMMRTADGAVRPLTTLDTTTHETSHRWPSFLPDGRHVVYLGTRSGSARSTAWVAPLDNPAARRQVASTDAQPLVAGATLLYAADDALVAQPLDPASWTPSGPSIVVGVVVGRGPLGQVSATAARDVLVFGAPGTSLRELRWVSRSGRVIGPMGEPVDAWSLRIAPSGSRVAVTERDAQVGTLDVWIHDGAQPVPLRVSRSTDVDEGPAWSPDGNRLAWASARRLITIRGAGAVLDEQVVATLAPPARVWDWSPDGVWLVVGQAGAGTADDVWVVPASGTGEPKPYARSPFSEIQAALAPDGRHLAYASNEAGQFDIYVDSFPVPGSRIRVTTAGGVEPRWRRDGAEIYFRRGSAIHAVALAAGASGLEARSTERLFDAGTDVRAYDVTADGARFLLNVPAASAAPRAATVVVNWLSREPKRRPGV